MRLFENKKFAEFPDSTIESQVKKRKFSSELSSYIDKKERNPELNKLLKEVNAIKEIREKYKTVEDLSSLRQEFKLRLKQGESLEQILPEAYALVIEAVSRNKTTSNGHPIELTDSQIMTSLVLNDGDIAELATGEGKTFALTMAAYLNAIEGDQVHIFTANDYLAQRDSEINTSIFESLGLKVGCALDTYVVDGIALDKKQSKEMRKRAYRELDIIYANPSTIPFDWEADQQILNPEDRMIVKPFHYAIVDEVDSVMIDDASTPLIISESLKSYEKKTNPDYEETENDLRAFNNTTRKKWMSFADSVVTVLRQNAKNTFRNSEAVTANPLYNKILIRGEHLAGTQRALNDLVEKKGAAIFIDERKKTVELTDVGYQLIGSMIQETGFDENEIFPYIQNALYAHCILQNNVDYRVSTDKYTGKKKVILIDPNTGRDLPDNKLSNGLHQALEIKEGIPINKVSKLSISTAKITHPSFFAKYQKVCGTSGTVSDEVTKCEFKEQYKKKIVEIPRSRKKIAVENPIEVYETKKQKMQAIVQQIVECQKKDQPILVGAKDIDEALDIMSYLGESYPKRDFSRLCMDVFHTPKEEINILKAAKLYCLMTNTDFPNDRRIQNAICRQVQSLILPENEKNALDYRVEKQLTEKLNSARFVPLESKEEIYRFLQGEEAKSRDQVEEFFIQLRGISYQSLTAKDTEREVSIISQAGRAGAVTIATAIAGRGTDIALGGDPKELARYEVEDIYLEKLNKKELLAQEHKLQVAKIKRQTELLSRNGQCDDSQMQKLFEQKLTKWRKTCTEEKAQLESTLTDSHGELMHQPGKGLYVLGASLNDSIRVDNQLRGRSGRQGSDGESKFICSLEDPLILQKGDPRKFEKMKAIARSNPSHRSLIRYVRTAQRSNESIQSSIRMDNSRCAKGFDWIADSYYTYRGELLDRPVDTLSTVFQSATDLLFDNTTVAVTEDTLSYFIPFAFSDNEVNNLSLPKLKELFVARSKAAIEEIRSIDSPDFHQNLRRQLLTVGDLRFTSLADGNIIENQLFLEQMTPNQSSTPDVMLDRVVFDQYNDFKADVILESSVRAFYYLRIFLKQEEEKKNFSRLLEDSHQTENVQSDSFVNASLETGEDDISPLDIISQAEDAFVSMDSIPDIDQSPKTR